MAIEAIAFDVNGTLVEIRTEDDMAAAFRAAGHFLTYQGIDLRRHEVRDLYFATMKQQLRASTELYPEFDAVAIWRTIVEDNASDFTLALPPDKLAQMPLFLAEIYRGISRRKLKLYPHVREVLQTLRTTYKLAIVTDAQSSYARGELHKMGIADLFDVVVVSADHGFRKPDPRLFQYALDGMGVAAQNAMYVGNDLYRDIYGARGVGMTTVLYDSDQGTKHYPGCTPDHVITDWRKLLGLLEPS